MAELTAGGIGMTEPGAEQRARGGVSESGLAEPTLSLKWPWRFPASYAMNGEVLTPEHVGHVYGDLQCTRAELITAIEAMRECAKRVGYSYATDDEPSLPWKAELQGAELRVRALLGMEPES